jgi:hypothetical protein
VYIEGLLKDALVNHRSVTLYSRAVLVAVVLAFLQANAHAAAPAGRYIVSNDTVLDTSTALVWQRAAVRDSHTWDAAGGECHNLTLGGFAPGSWRLPTKLELETLVDESLSDPAIDATAFRNVEDTYLWSSSPYVPTAGFAWGVYFLTGASSPAAQSSGYGYLCVH